MTIIYFAIKGGLNGENLSVCVFFFFFFFFFFFLWGGGGLVGYIILQHISASDQVILHCNYFLCA